MPEGRRRAASRWSKAVEYEDSEPDDDSEEGESRWWWPRRNAPGDAPYLLLPPSRWWLDPRPPPKAPYPCCAMPWMSTYDSWPVPRKALAASTA